MRKLNRLTLTLVALLLTAVTGAMAQTETLLTTITATDKEQASYSTANVATVSFSYLPDGSSHYSANWGWWGYGWSATVNAAEGYTITKCVFYDNTDHTATDSEAPFVVETTENDKQPKVNGNYIYQYSSSAGIKKIEVFGTAGPTEWSLTPDETGKKWTLAKMPASNIELQVEYFAESNLFLSKDALADKDNIVVKNGETTVAFDDNGKSADPVTEGNTVTAKFTGKKVLGMTVEKKSASKLASEVTPDDIFKVIASDGMIYDNIAAAESAGTVAQGLVVYVGSNTGHNTYTHGMALALKDESDNTWSGAKDACNAKNTSTPIVGALWIQASKDQWNTMFNAVGNDSKLRDCFSSAGGTNLVKFGNYWSGSSHEDYGEQGDFYIFSEDDGPGGWGSTSVYYNDNYHVRACIVF